MNLLQRKNNQLISKVYVDDNIKNYKLGNKNYSLSTTYLSSVYFTKNSIFNDISLNSSLYNNNNNYINNVITNSIYNIYSNRRRLFRLNANIFIMIYA
jgi:hypothetical protein